MSELKPCPWCGDAAELNQYGHRYWAVCSGCRSYRSGTDEHKIDAIEAWNQRHAPIRTKLRALVQEWRDKSHVALVECFDRKDRGIAMGRAGCARELEALIGGEDK